MKSAMIGQMATKITVKALTPGKDEEGIPAEIWTDVFGHKVYCHWQNAHGSELFEAMRQEIKELATVTMRYSPLVTPRCRIWYEDETQDTAHAYEIISVDNVESARRFLEIKVKRVVEG